MTPSIAAATMATHVQTASALTRYRRRLAALRLFDTLQVGDQVLAYESASGKVQAEPVEHIFINHDDNLLDVTLASDASTQATPATGCQQA